MTHTKTHARASLVDGFAAVRNDLAARRARRVESRRLEQELAAYTSPRDMAEIDAIIARAPASEAAYLERVVTRARAA